MNKRRWIIVVVTGALATVVAAPAVGGGPEGVSSVGALPAATAYRDCIAVQVDVPGAESGYYAIDPDGPAGVPPLEAYCDMEADGGGWTVIDYDHDAGWQAHFGSWQVIDAGRAATSGDTSLPSPSWDTWIRWLTPAEDTTVFRISPLCQEISSTVSIAEAYATTGSFYGCTWYDDNCDMDPVTQECYWCTDDWGQYRQGTCSHLVQAAGGEDCIYAPYPYRCVGDWWNRAPAMGIAGKYCVAYRLMRQIYLPLLERGE